MFPLKEKSLLFSFFTLGVSSLIGQSLILRELIIAFYGNELFSSLTLGFWLLLVGIGSLLIARLLQKINSLKIILTAQFLITIFLPLEIFLIRLVKNLLTLPGEIPNLLLSLVFVFLILSPLCLILGLFWTITSKLYGELKNDFSLSITQAYFFETLGFIVAGLIFSFFLVYLNELFSVFLVIVLNLSSLLWLLYCYQKKSFKILFILCSVFCLAVFFFINNKDLQIKTLNLRFKNQILKESINSKYGNLAVTKLREKDDQFNFYQNGLLIGSNQEKNFNEQLIHLPLLQSTNPKNILLIGQGFNGAVNEILKHPAGKVYYLEMDSKLVPLAKKYLSPDLVQTLENPLVKIIFQDARHFLKKNQEKFNIVILNLPDPSSLLINRLYTEQFFKQIKDNLDPRGLVSTHASFSQNYFSDEAINFNASIFRALKQNFNQVLVLPLETNLFFLASDQNLIAEPEKIIERFQERNITANFITPQWLSYYFSNDRVGKINALLTLNKTHTNTDFYPSAYLSNSLFWLKQFQPKTTKILNELKEIRPVYILLFLFLLLIVWRKKISAKSLAFITAIPDFTLLGLEILFIFCFQVIYGHIYHYLALLITSIMLGIALGNYWAWKKISAEGGKTGINISSLIIIYSCLILLCLFVMVALKYSLNIWLIAPFLAGILIGLEFPLTNYLFLKTQGQKEQKTGLIYSADLIGSCLGAILVPLFFIPFFGVYPTLFFLIGLNVLAVFGLKLIRF